MTLLIGLIVIEILCIIYLKSLLKSCYTFSKSDRRIAKIILLTPVINITFIIIVTIIVILEYIFKSDQK